MQTINNNKMQTADFGHLEVAPPIGRFDNQINYYEMSHGLIRAIIGHNMKPHNYGHYI